MNTTNREVKDFTKRTGLFRNLPRSLKGLVRRRLQDLESDPNAFDREALIHRPQLKRLYALLHIAPGERAQETLFGEPPEDSPVAAVARLAKSKNAKEAADIVETHKLSYLLTESTLGRLTDPVAIALIHTLPRAELLSRLRLFAKRGLLKGSVVKALRKRLKSLAEDQEFQLPYRKAESVCRLAKLDKELASLVMSMVRTEGSSDALTGHTAILVDGSLSMTSLKGSEERAAQLLSFIDQSLEESSSLWLSLAGSEITVEKLPRGRKLAHWRKTISGEMNNMDDQGTSLGQAVRNLLDQCSDLQRLVILTDGYENRGPRLHQVLNDQRIATGFLPSLCIALVPEGGRQLAMDLKQNQISSEVFQLQKDGIGLEAITATLIDSKQNDDVADILNYPLD